jgi:glutamate-1-semialdehyde 2,1-aminomutase
MSRYDEALHAAEHAYRARTPLSEAAFETSCVPLPGGNTRSNLHFGPYPPVVERADGAVLVDIDGNRYDDFNCDYTVAVAGHSHPALAEATRSQIERGTNWGARSAAEVQLASAVLERFPSLQQLRFVNSGTEANLMAFVTARAVTGRNRIVVFDGGYHGSLFSYVAAQPRINVPEHELRLPYNDIEALRSAFREHGRDIAAVFTELMLNSGGCVPATPGFARELRALCDEYGSLLVIDEVMTARHGFNGLQGRYGVTGDVVTLGKIFGGGFPIGAFAASTEVMAMFDMRRSGAVSHGGSFNNEVFSMHVGLTSCREVLTDEALEGLYLRGEVLRERLNRVLCDHGLPLVLSGLGSTMALHPGRQPPQQYVRSTTADRIRRLFHLRMLAEGQWVAGRAMITTSLATTAAQVERFIEVFDGWCRTDGAVVREEIGGC